MEARVLKAADAKIEEKRYVAGKEAFRTLEKAFVLQLLDQHWKEHLLNLDHLRQGISLRAFGQRDPLNEYKAEAFALFETMLNNLRESVTQTLNLVEVNVDPEAIRQMQRQHAEAQKKMMEGRADPAMGSSAQGEREGKVQSLPVRNATFDQNDPATWGNTPRNAPCPCGSGKKYKQCHGAVV